MALKSKEIHSSRESIENSLEFIQVNRDDN